MASKGLSSLKRSIKRILIFCLCAYELLHGATLPAGASLCPEPLAVGSQLTKPAIMPGDPATQSSLLVAVKLEKDYKMTNGGIRLG
jgi:hypothetical protein